MINNFVLLKSPRGDWNFVKGHKENQESDHDTLKREIFEEIGITNFSILNYLGKIRYKIMKAEFQVQKEVKFHYVTSDLKSRLNIKDEINNIIQLQGNVKSISL